MQQTSSSSANILLIDDDIKFCRLISDYLKRFAYEVTCSYTGNQGLEAALQGSFDAIVVDVMLPGIDGFEVLRRFREQRDTPVLMLTSLGEETDRIIGLEMGADDYLPKTSSPRELLARLRAVLRRASRPSGSASESAAARVTQTIVVGPVSINSASRIVALHGEELQLTPVEFELLLVLAQSRNRVKSREELINEIRDRHYDVYDRSIDVHISALRRKLKDDPRNPRFIRTVRAAGYMFVGGDM